MMKIYNAPLPLFLKRSSYRRKGLLSPFQFLDWVAHSFKSKYPVHFESFIVQCLFKTHVHTLDFLENQSAKW